MTEVGPATPRRTRTGHSYANQWNRFVAWAQASGRGSLPASPEDVAAYLEEHIGDGCEALDPASGGGGDSAQSQGLRFRRTCPSWRRPDRAGRADAGRCSRPEQGDATGLGLLSRHKEDGARAALGKGRSARAHCERPQARRGGHRHDRPDAGC